MIGARRDADEAAAEVMRLKNEVIGLEKEKEEEVMRLEKEKEEEVMRLEKELHEVLGRVESQVWFDHLDPSKQRLKSSKK